MPDLAKYLPEIRWRKKEPVVEKAQAAGGSAASLANAISQMAQEAIRETAGDNTADQMGPGAGIDATPLDRTGQPRRWQYRPGWNLPTQPGEGRRVTYDTLQQVADMYDIARKAIEFRKDELCSLPWDITVRETDKRKQRELLEKNRDRITALKRRFDKPDGRNSYQAWLRQGLEDHFVLDAMSQSVMRNLRGDVVGWRWIDGATIKPRLDATGEIPMRPGVAYQQFLFGFPRFNFFEASDPMEYREALRRWHSGEGRIVDQMYGPNNTSGIPPANPGELRYRPRNKRNHTVYGFSHIEGILTHVNIALRWQLWEQAFWVEGNIPQALVSVPEDWTQPQIEEYQAWWDTLMSGNPAGQRSLRFVPGGSKVFDIEPALEHSTEFAQYLMTITLMIFDVNRAEIGLDPLNSEGLGGKGHQEGQAQQTQRASLRPLAAWLKSEFFDQMLREDLGEDDLEWVWPSLVQDNEREIAEVNQILLYSGQKALDEIISEQGGDPVGVGRMLVLGSQVYMEKDLIEMAKNGALSMQQEQQQDLAEHQSRLDRDEAQHQSGLNKDEASHSAATQPKPAAPANKSAEPDIAKCSCGCDDGCAGDECGCDCQSCHPRKAALSDLTKWERKAVKAVKDGKSAQVRFQTTAIDNLTYTELWSRLGDAWSASDVRTLFRTYRDTLVSEEDRLPGRA